MLCSLPTSVAILWVQALVNFRYRADVDGLRAVAVVAVLLFHAGLGCTGGFVGVDVFFVISGFLITGLILSQQAKQAFRLKEFWVRRIKRIAPAAATMVLTTLVAGYFLLLPTDYRELAHSALWQQLFVSNVFFWRNTGYFDGAAELKPLLHTWSLAVEEQFYFFYPVLLLLINRFGERQKCGILALLTAGSFAVCCVGMIVNPNATFFLLPTRAWEMSLGGLLCFAPELKGRRIAELMSASGMVLVLYGVLMFDHSTVFPGASALVPTLGALLVILGCSHSEPTRVCRILSAKPMVAVGLVSYSLYLWHWPVMAYYRYWFGSELGLNGAVLCLSASTLLALTSYFLVESPLRHLKTSSVRHSLVFRGILATAPALVLMAAVVFWSQGMPGRLPEQAQAFDLAKESTQFTDETLREMILQRKLPTFGAEAGPVKVAVWGDSHAMAIVAGVDAACRELGIRGVKLTRSMTPPLLNMDVPTKDNFAATTSQFNASAVEYLREQQLDLVILAGYWQMYEGDPAFDQSLQASLDSLDESGIRYCVVKDVAHGSASFPRLLAQAAWRRLPTENIGTDAKRYAVENARVNAIMDRLQESGAMILDPGRWLCREDGSWPAETNGVSLYRDADHLSVDGARLLKPMFLDALGTVAPVYTDVPLPASEPTP